MKRDMQPPMGGRKLVNAAGFDAFFRATTGNTPYDYQRRLAGFDEGKACESQLISIPTGLGKTAGVVLAWLWNRVGHADGSHRATWPRRLVYCLPMRTLVEQTKEAVGIWLDRLRKAADEGHINFPAEAAKEICWLGSNSPIVLMGGECQDREWDIYPEKPAIIIGTQDMLLSRALNRGYGMSRYRWPMHFGLLNNDCLWVMDETQLMGVGVETSAQLDGFRHQKETASLHPCPTWWMSATLEDVRLATADHPKPDKGWPSEKLSDEEQAAGRPRDLITASKKLSVAPIRLSSGAKDYPLQLARLIKERHQAGTLTLVIVNRVKRAQEVYQALTKGKTPLIDAVKVGLIHSRFRAGDRERHAKFLVGEGDRVVIATQAVEAGIDVSARLLITELAPWASMVQRFGRCNRRAEFSNAEVLWVDIEPKDEKDNVLRPYQQEELVNARSAIKKVNNASPQEIGKLVVAEEKVVRPVIRRRDLVDLFDTTPDLCGQDLDISRYIRDGDDNDVQFFWRVVQEGAPDKNAPAPYADELCRVPIADAVKFLGRKLRAWRWNPLGEQWETAVSARPGEVYLLDVEAGGYDDALGWTNNPKDKPTPHTSASGRVDAYTGNESSFLNVWQTLADHTTSVINEVDKLAHLLAKDYASALHDAALWHDVGKSHEVFQSMLRNGDPTRESATWAKSARRGGRCSRFGFRHELASALAWLLASPQEAAWRDLAAYLIAAHHGKVRLSIRSLPGEKGDPQNSERLFARGIWDGDLLPNVALGEVTVPAVGLDLSFMQMGEGRHGPSWLARTIALRDRLGPFGLAYLEALLRAGDMRSSAQVNDSPEAAEVQELIIQQLGGEA